MSEEKEKQLAEAKAKAAAAARAKAEALKKMKEKEAAESSSDTLAEEKVEATADAKAKAAAAAKAKAAALKKMKEKEAAESGGDASTDEKAKAAAAAKAKAAAAAKAKAAALKKMKEKEAAESGGDASTDEKAKAAAAAKAKGGASADEKAKAIAAAKAKAAAAAKARAAAGGKAASEAVEGKPSPNQPILDRYLKIIKENLGDDILEDAYINRLAKDVPTLLVKSEHYFKLAQFLKHNESLSFDYLSEHHASDFETHMEIYNHLYSFKTKENVAFKTKIDRDHPVIDSITPIWAGANWPEREAYDLLGVHYTNHPNLTRIMLPDDWVGHPLRKDYVQFDEEV